MTEGGLIAARAIAYLAMLLAAGLPLYILSAGRGVTVTRRLRVGIGLAALIGAAASIWWALASIAAMAAVPLGDLDQEMVTAVLGATPLGSVLALRLVLLGLLCLVLVLPLGRASTAALAVFGGAALASAAWTGHAAATEGTFGTVHRLADVLHLLAAATWLGALAVLIVSAFSRLEVDALEARLAGFATTGTGIVAALLLSGLVNTVAISGWPLPPTFFSSQWTASLALKLAIFAGMLGLAALNRWRLTPALASGKPHAAAHLRRSLAVEASGGIAIVALVAVLGLLDPST